MQNLGAKLLFLLSAAALAAGCGGGSGYGSNPTTPNPPSSAPAAALTITINGNDGGMSFAPADAVLRVGQTVAWRNADSTVHHVVQDSNSATPGGGGYDGPSTPTGGLDTGSIAPGATTAPITLSAQGALHYHCSIHPGMVGALTVNP